MLTLFYILASVLSLLALAGFTAFMGLMLWKSYRVLSAELEAERRDKAAKLLARHRERQAEIKASATTPTA